MFRNSDLDSQCSHVSMDESTVDCSMHHLWLPPEIVSSIFEHLDDAGLLAASGVSQQWYEVASTELNRRGKTVYRWPRAIPSSANFLCVVGDRGIGRVLRECKSIKTLEISYDVPTKISSSIMEQVSLLGLEKLRLRNVFFDADNSKTLLESEISTVEIHTRKKKHLSRKSKHLLMENKELLNGILISSDLPQSSLHGIYPNPLSYNHCERLDNNTVVLEASGLHDFRFGPSLTNLTITEGLHLTKRELSDLSRIKLKKLAVSMCNVEEEAWCSSFSNGFDNLRCLSVINCSNLGVDTIMHISTKSELSTLSLDIRHLTEVEECVANLQESTSLKELTLITVGASEFTEEMFLRKKWTKLRKLVIKNHGFCEMKKTVHDNLKKSYESLDIDFEYQGICTLRRTTLQLDKDFSTIVQL